MDRMENVVTEEADKQEEEQKIRSALADCGNPKWTFDRVKQQRDKTKPTKAKKTNATPSRGMVCYPVRWGCGWKIKKRFPETQRGLTNTPKNILVHPKDKKDITETSDVVYDIPCKGCDKSYIGETGHLFGTRLQEHQKNSEKKSKTLNSHWLIESINVWTT